MADAKVTTEILRVLSGKLEDISWPGYAHHIRNAIALIESQAAENARMAAELERLTPKPMTLKEACRVMGEHEFRGWKRWGTCSLNGDAYACPMDDEDDCDQDAYVETAAIAIAQYLIREKEAARA